MKKSIVLSIVLAVFILHTSGVFAQKTDKKTKKDDQEILQKQKNQQEQQLKMLQEIMKQNMEEQRKALERMKEENIQQTPSERDFFYGKNNWSGRGFYTPPYSNKSSTLTLQKTFKKQTGVSSTSFDVDEKVTSIRFTVRGSVNNKDGYIKIDISSPDNREYKSFFIKNTADIMWTQTLKITDENKKKYIGEWGISVAVNEAEGNYNVTVFTF